MLNSIMTILSLFPALIAAIKSVEEAIPGSSRGKEKLDIILNSILAINDTLKDLMPAIASVVGVIVAGFNATGVFKK